MSPNVILTRGLWACAAGFLTLSACDRADQVSAPDRSAVASALGVNPDLVAEGDEKVIPDGLVLTEESESSEAFGLSSVGVTSTPAIWEPAFGTGLNQTDDDCDFVSFGFTFEFYGIPYTGVWVNSNGNLTFTACNTEWWHPDIPDGANVIIAPLYGDFNPAVAGDVFRNTVGSAPHRQLVVTWAGVPEFNSIATQTNTFQATLSEGSNTILFGYGGLATDGINWAFQAPSTEGNMEVGISSGTGRFTRSAAGAQIPALDGTNVCYVPAGDDYVEVFGPCVLDIDIDVKPGSDVNPLNLRSRGVIPVAVLGSAGFDVTTLDVTSLAFGPAGATPAHDLTDPAVYADHLQDVDGDGWTDLVSHYRTVQTGIGPDDSEACLSGLTATGVPVHGCDTVRVDGV